MTAGAAAGAATGVDAEALARTTLALAGFGPAALAALLDAAGSAERAVAAPRRYAKQLPSSADDAVTQLTQSADALSEAARAYLAFGGRGVVAPADADYPPLLAKLPDPPLLFYEGDLNLALTAQIAIVGSRSATAGGLEIAEQFARAFIAAGFTVTSGLAAGIDAAAHRASLAAGGATIAVVGTGLDLVYPASNRKLAGDIAERGLLISQFPPGTPPRKGHFPLRNAVIAGLSLGTLVIEAGQRSGALITARLAGDAGREVFAVPGSIRNPYARGCHRLIRQGAALVETPDEVIAALAPMALELAGLLRAELDAEAKPEKAKPRRSADPAVRAVLAALGHDPADLDTLVARSGLTVQELSSTLVSMELDGLVTARLGRYTRT